MSVIISKTIMWLSWVFMVLVAILMSINLTKSIANINTFGRPFDAFAIGIFLIPNAICGGFRLWLLHIRHPWLALLPYLPGLFFACMAESYGFFLLPEFLIVFQILSAMLFLAYLPLFIRLVPTGQGRPEGRRS